MENNSLLKNYQNLFGKKLNYEGKSVKVPAINTLWLIMEEMLIKEEMLL